MFLKLVGEKSCVKESLIMVKNREMKYIKKLLIFSTFCTF